MVEGLFSGGSDDWRDHYYYFVTAGDDIATFDTLQEAIHAAQSEADYETLDITIKHKRRPVMVVSPRAWRAGGRRAR